MSAKVTPRQLAESYWKAEESRDIARILAHYHADAVFCPPGQRLVGHDQIRTFYEDSAAGYPGLEVEIVREISSGDTAAFEWSAVLVDHQGVRHPLHGANMVWLENGKYREVHAFFDPHELDT